MPQGLNVDNLIVSQGNGRSLYKAADVLQQNKQFDQDELDKAKAQKNSSIKFLTDYLDPKDHLTGTPFDGMTVKGYGDLLNQGVQMAGQGVDTNTIVSALLPGVQKLAAYTTNAKLVNNQINDSLGKLKGFKGYNPEAIKSAAQKLAFYNPDGSIKDPTTLDPNTNWVEQAVKSNPLEATTDEGINAYAKESPKSNRIENVTTVDKHGNKTTHKLQVTATNWETPEVGADGKIALVPKYQVATDNGKPQTHDFTDENGKVTTSPIRLFDDNEFEKMMHSNPAIADHIIGLTKQNYHEDKPFDINDPHTRRLARAMAYDYLKSQGSSTVNEATSQTLSPQQIKINLGLPLTGKGSTTAPSNFEDAYNEIKSKIGSNYTPVALTDLSMDTQQALIEKADKLTNHHFAQDGIYVSSDSDGNINLMKKGKGDQPYDNIIATISPYSINKAVNKGGGTKVNQAIIKNAHQQQQQPEAVPDWKKRAIKIEDKKK
jgi:hypothetical protein